MTETSTQNEHAIRDLLVAVSEEAVKMGHHWELTVNRDRTRWSVTIFTTDAETEHRAELACLADQVEALRDGIECSESADDDRYDIWDLLTEARDNITKSAEILAEREAHS